MTEESKADLLEALQEAKRQAEMAYAYDPSPYTYNAFAACVHALWAVLQDSPASTALAHR
jgi:hypothetical protein